jgi:hypothetical protein
MLADRYGLAATTPRTRISYGACISRHIYDYRLLNLVPTRAAAHLLASRPTASILLTEARLPRPDILLWPFPCCGEVVRQPRGMYAILRSISHPSRLTRTLVWELLATSRAFISNHGSTSPFDGLDVARQDGMQASFVCINCPCKPPVEIWPVMAFVAYKKRAKPENLNARHP